MTGLPPAPLRADALPDLLTVPEVAAYLRTTPAAIYQLFYRGTLSPVQIGRRRLVRREDLLEFCRVSPPSHKEAGRCQ
ncbi:MAG: helix-turn-helix domain-containing protein [bacterium]